MTALKSLVVRDTSHTTTGRVNVGYVTVYYNDMIDLQCTRGFILDLMIWGRIVSLKACDPSDFSLSGNF